MSEKRTIETVAYPFQGKRVELIAQPGGFQLLKPGEYGKWITGKWFGCSPNGHGCNLSSHDVVEHEDGTITVSPSILINSQREEWHGFLRRGVWTLA